MPKPWAPAVRPRRVPDEQPLWVSSCKQTPILPGPKATCPLPYYPQRVSVLNLTSSCALGAGLPWASVHGFAQHMLTPMLRKVLPPFFPGEALLFQCPSWVSMAKGLSMFSDWGLVQVSTSPTINNECLSSLCMYCVARPRSLCCLLQLFWMGPHCPLVSPISEPLFWLGRHQGRPVSRNC